MRQTTNYGLKITEGNDDWRNIFDDNADNMDVIDDAIAPMTGATASDNGTSGVVPEPESGDQNKFLKGDASWAIPGVMTVNGRSPDAAGNITVIEGGGSSSYGSYRLDAIIPVSAWAGDGPYVATVSNQYITANMDGTETWLDDEAAMLGGTTFTTSNGLLTISTTVKPTAEWSLHVALAVNGADVLADISNIRGDVDDNTAAITDLSTNKAYQISIANADAIAAVYEKLNALTNGITATVYIGGTAMSNLTNSAYSAAATGTVGKITSSNYRFNLVVGNNTPIQIDQTGMSSSSWGTSTVNDVSSTIGHGTAITASSLSALKTNLLSVANKADVNGFIAVKITPSFTSDGFTSGSNYGGHIYNIYKSNGATTYFSAIVSNNLGEDVLIGYSNGTWYFNSLKKNVDALNGKATINAIQYNNIDLNTLTKPGVYACNNCTNAPSTGWFNVEVLPIGGPGDGNENYAIQRATQIGSNNIYERANEGGTWRSWEQLALKSQIDTLNSNLNTVVSDALTSANSNVLINMQRRVITGKVVTYNLVLEVSAQLARNVDILTGLQEHNGGFNGVPTVVATNNEGSFTHFSVADGGKLISAEAIQTGRWRMVFSYIAV